MATIKVNGTSYFISISKITTPSIKINGQGYIPLFSGNKNSTVDYNRYRYTLGGLKVGNYRAAVSRSLINSAPTIVGISGYVWVRSDENVELRAIASDPDGDTLTYEWYRYVNARDQSQYIGGGSSITVSETASSSNTTRHYWCRVTDSYGASATSEVHTVTWYYNHSPRIVISDYPSESTDGNIQFTITCYDEDGDTNCTVTYGYRSYGSGGSMYDQQTASLTRMNATSVGVRTTERTVIASKQGPDTNGNYWYYIYAAITDSHGASARDVVRINHVKPTPAYKCTVECWKKEWSSGGYTSGPPTTWHVKVTALRYPSSCEGIYVFGKIGNGSGWIYKSDEIDFYSNYKPSTIDLTPYTTFSNTFTYTGSYGQVVTVTEPDQQAAGTVKTVAVSFPNKEGESHKNTYTFEWN